MSNRNTQGLWIAHLDCDAFYAAVEKRDDPSLWDKPVIVGGGRRGVVLTACYMARKFGAKSAMPMFQALKLCPQATIVPPNMGKYAGVAREVRAKMLAVTPQVEPVSLDEAYLDLSGTERLHGMVLGDDPRETRQKHRERDRHHRLRRALLQQAAGKTGIRHRQAARAGRDRARRGQGFLAQQTGRESLRGVGPVLQARLAKDGITLIQHLQDSDIHSLTSHYGDTGSWLLRLSAGEDDSVVDADGETKSMSAETTFEENIKSFPELEAILWEQAERVSARAKAASLGGRTVTLKLKTSGFQIKTRSATLDHPTQLAEVIFRVGRALLKREATGTAYRLLGIGVSHIWQSAECDPPDLPIPMPPAAPPWNMRWMRCARNSARAQLRRGAAPSADFRPASIPKARCNRLLM